MVADASMFNIPLIRILCDYTRGWFIRRGLKRTMSHSGILGQEVATLALFSPNFYDEVKVKFLSTMRVDHSLHVVRPLLLTILDLLISRFFFRAISMDDSLLLMYQFTSCRCVNLQDCFLVKINNLQMVNDCTECSFALMQNYNAAI